jgi:Cathepsin propeptide inhibitor domain (I29)
MKLDVLPKSLMLVFAVVIGRYAANASSSSSSSSSLSLLDAAAENEYAEKSEMILSSSSSAMMEPLFKEWMTAFEKVYDSHQEKVSRLEIWMENDGACFY